MKLTKKQAKIILIVGWSLFALVYLAAMILSLIQNMWPYVFLLILTAVSMIVEYKRYIKWLKQRK